MIFPVANETLKSSSNNSHRQRLSAQSPRFRDTVRSHIQSNDSTYNRAIGVDVAANASCRPHGFFVVVNICRRQPKTKRHRILITDLDTASDLRRHGECPGIKLISGRPFKASSHLGWSKMRNHPGNQLSWRGGCFCKIPPPRPCSSQRDGDRSRNSFRMSVRDSRR